MTLGKYSYNKMVDDIWDEGEDFIKLKIKLNEIGNQKIELDNFKKKIKKNEKEILKKVDDMNKVNEINEKTNSSKKIPVKVDNVISELTEPEINDQLELIEFNKNQLIKVINYFKYITICNLFIRKKKKL